MQSLTAFQGIQIAIYGFVTVFIMLAALMFIIMILSRIVDASTAKNAKPVEETAKKPEPVVEEKKIDTTEYVGEVSLIDVDEKTAACIMAIISDQTQIPLQNLIFKKISLVRED